MFEGLLYQFVYNLKRHRLLNLPIRHWLILLCLAVPVAAWLQVWKISRLMAVPVTVGAVAILVGIWWAERQRYVRFVEWCQRHSSDHSLAETGAAGPPSPSLPPMHKLEVHATGFFEVSGMRRYWVETPAQYVTFETREHCVMTRIPHSRLLLVGRSSRQEVGWWYIFFQPGMVKAIRSGCLHFGLHPRRALRLEIAAPNENGGEILYLSFDDDTGRSLVLADLQQDADLVREPYTPPSP